MRACHRCFVINHRSPLTALEVDFHISCKHKPVCVVEPSSQWETGRQRERCLPKIILLPRSAEEDWRHKQVWFLHPFFLEPEWSSNKRSLKRRPFPLRLSVCYVGCVTKHFLAQVESYSISVSNWKLPQALWPCLNGLHYTFPHRAIPWCTS